MIDNELDERAAARNACDNAYRLALVCAKAEYDEQIAELEALKARTNALRQSINALSTLVNELVPDVYTYGYSAIQKARFTRLQGGRPKVSS